MLLYTCDMLSGHDARLPCWKSPCSIREMQTHDLTAIMPQKPSPGESWVCVRGCSQACSPAGNWEKCGKRLSHLQMKFLDPRELIPQVKAILSWRVDVVQSQNQHGVKNRVQTTDRRLVRWGFLSHCVLLQRLSESGRLRSQRNTREGLSQVYASKQKGRTFAFSSVCSFRPIKNGTLSAILATSQPQVNSCLPCNFVLTLIIQTFLTKNKRWHMIMKNITH